MSDNLVCSHCGVGENIKRFKRTTPLCWSHYLQMRRHGRILERTKYTPNEYRVEGDVAYITLYEGERTPIAEAIIDVDDLARVLKYKWHRAIRKGKIYAEAFMPGKTRFLHQFILGYKRYKNIDHANANGLDNRKANLRFVSQHQNVLNANMPSKSGRMGVNWRESRTCWVATIRINGKARNRHFKVFEDAVICRQQWEREFVGATVEDMRRI